MDNISLQTILQRTQPSPLRNFAPAEIQEESFVEHNFEVEVQAPQPTEETATPARVAADDFIAQWLEQNGQVEVDEPAKTISLEDLAEQEEEREVDKTELPVPDNEETYKATNFIVRDETVRFSSAEWFKKTQEQSVLIAGVGGIGSWCALLIAKLHPKNIVLYDMDSVESVNLAGQLYSRRDLGLPKVEAIARTIEDYTNYGNIITCNARFTEHCSAEKIMICGFDNMDARKLFFFSWKKLVETLPEEERNQCLFIDGRLSAKELQIFCIVGDDSYSMQRYVNDYLFEDYEAEDEVCSFKQTAYMANMIGGLMTNLFVNFCANLCDLVMPRIIPFKTSYLTDNMFFKLEN